MRVAQDVPSRKLAVPRDTDLIRDSCFREFLFGATDVTDFGDRVDADRQQLTETKRRFSSTMS